MPLLELTMKHMVISHVFNGNFVPCNGVLVVTVNCLPHPEHSYSPLREEVPERGHNFLLYSAGKFCLDARWLFQGTDDKSFRQETDCETH